MIPAIARSTAPLVPRPLRIAVIATIVFGLLAGGRAAASSDETPLGASVLEDAKLHASDADTNDLFGHGVGVSGTIVVVGAQSDAHEGSSGGSAYVFTDPPGSFRRGVLAEVAKLRASDPAAGDDFGHDAAVSGDTIVVGAWQDDDNGADSGSAYVFVEPPGGWNGFQTESAKLLPSDGAAGDLFGASVAVSGDTIVVGAYQHSAGATQTGAVYLFVEPPGGWAGTITETAKLLHPGRLNFDRLGRRVAVSGDTVVAGAGDIFRAGIPGGAAYVWVAPPLGWAGTLDADATLLPTVGHLSQRFGDAVAISGDRIAIGARATVVNTVQTGAAYVFVEPAGGWLGSMNEDARLLASDAAVGDYFGETVAISGDLVVVGAPFEDEAGSDAGAAYAYFEPAGGWSGEPTEDAKLIASDGSNNDSFGFSIELSGRALVVGVPYDDDFGTSSGSAYGFDLTPVLFEDGFESGDTSAWSTVVP